MAYTLVNATALAFDLVRVASGPVVADVLLHAMAADAGALQHLANHHHGPCRADCWSAVTAAASRLPRPGADLALAGPAIELAAAGQAEASQELVTRLSRSPLGDLAALERFIRREALDWTWEVAGDLSVQRLRDRLAADVLVDAAASAYCCDVLEDGARRHLAAYYLAAQRRPDSVVVPPIEGRAGLVLAEVAGWSASDRDDWRTAVDLLRSGSTKWSTAMHEAGWAAHLAGRTRTAAELQLHAVQAFRDAGLTPDDAAGGCWNALSGLLQALVVDDLLPDDQVATLLRPWHLARARGIPGT